MTSIINLGVRVAREQWVVCTVPYLKINKMLKLLFVQACKAVLLSHEQNYNIRAWILRKYTGIKKLKQHTEENGETSGRKDC